MSILNPRIIIIRRETEFDKIKSVYSTLQNAKFDLDRKGISLSEVENNHYLFLDSLKKIRDSIPIDWKQVTLMRQDISQFLFMPEDIIIAYGQDGLIANISKYLDGQIVIGTRFENDNQNVLNKFLPKDIEEVLHLILKDKIKIEERTMAEAIVTNGEKIYALNEIFIGHRSHQSAKYVISLNKKKEKQFSSGIIVSTGTGMTGWASSILKSINQTLNINPEDNNLAYFVRECWPGLNKKIDLVFGTLNNNNLEIISEMDDGGVIFADGIETDFIKFSWGNKVSIQTSNKKLRLATI